MQETRNKMPAASVYLLENAHFLPFFVADSRMKCVKLPDMEAKDSQNILPACVLPRRRFVRVCLLALFLCNLVCVVVRFYAVHHPDWRILKTELVLGGLMMLLIFGPLLIPVRSRRGSKLQVLGLVCALLLSFVICCADGWEKPDSKELNYSLYLCCVSLMGVLLFIFVYIPVWLAHLFMNISEKRHARKGGLPN